jgi:hypothetical protein
MTRWERLLRPPRKPGPGDWASAGDRAHAVTPPCLASGPSPSVLLDIHRPQIRIAIWQRRLPASVDQQLAAQCVLMPRQQRFSLTPNCAVEGPLDGALSRFMRAPAGAEDPWRSDLHLMLSLARQLAPQAALRVCIETRACNERERFHVDHVALRLICTYRGQGTQWLPAHLLETSRGEGGNDAVPAAMLHEIPSGAIAVMKGRRYPGQPDSGLVHRSPMAGVDSPRILAMVDIDFA